MYPHAEARTITGHVQTPPEGGEPFRRSGGNSPVLATYVCTPNQKREPLLTTAKSFRRRYVVCRRGGNSTTHHIVLPSRSQNHHWPWPNSFRGEPFVEVEVTNTTPLYSQPEARTITDHSQTPEGVSFGVEAINHAPLLYPEQKPEPSLATANSFRRVCPS
ncbi:hypothetical protein AVEN_248845-1 [Araneus ventricosus]|uniref:Uncharacterized protein n=1 Tax=Araneus ventricosus TaxID=182803 RepID=A0A4Y2MHW0_ARAVE|nr:hypothetical protein AVEN_248845-1 [Araneus ventricosus]